MRTWFSLGFKMRFERHATANPLADASRYAYVLGMTMEVESEKM